jgi:replicative DNA helicase
MTTLVGGEEERPAALHAEMTILGGMTVDEIAVEDATRILKSSDFALDSHRRIYAAMLDLVEKKSPIDIVTLSQELKRCKELDSVGGVEYLASLTEGLPRKLSVQSYVAIVKDKSLARDGIDICDQAARALVRGDKPAAEVLARMEKEASDAVDGMYHETSIDEQSDIEYEKLERQRRGDAAVFIPSGLETLDRIHGGYALGEMTVVAARPNIGKSTMLRQAIVENCGFGNFVHLVSPEMESGRVLRCLWAFIAQVPYNKLRFPERMTSKENELIRLAKLAVASWPLKIDDGSMTIHDAVSRGRQVKRKHDTKLFVLDYLQQLDYPGGPANRAAEISAGAKALTDLGKLGMAVVAVSALTEEDAKKNAPPTMHMLRGSGDIKYAADSVYLLHREMDSETQKLVPETMLIAGKSRSDQTGSVKVYLDGSMQRFMSQDEWLRGLGK